MNKRLLKELSNLKNNESGDYCIDYDDSNINLIYLYIKCPIDSLYNFTFLKFKVEFINYPFEPPVFTFLNFDPNIRIHPNLYGLGKVCLSILNTFGNGWNISMSFESIIYSIISILDNKPYTHEPDCNDNEDYNSFVRYINIKFLLIDYLKNENSTILKEYITKHFLNNYTLLIDFIKSKNKGKKQINTKYSQSCTIDYSSYIPILEELYSNLHNTINSIQ